ncbi:hypothetical protein LEP1GSC193_3307 [Leptospira alstonii serovar Pingchang str. 80-412]|uniref:Uncharacterized protein n=2 Tax=Leptospira alstonii TaxID=28452 RepID=M6CXX7_9LEPT|nr:hypothetical protein LEP1GSC194_3443 [Leptospira alstonii serovar Sichuan str. 79601]EQA80539.1 hypothetical protein LEP1GSC193_3307 [Leptospira alstonii serovar Pingchang str. 80-412]
MPIAVFLQTDFPILENRKPRTLLHSTGQNYNLNRVVEKLILCLFH